MNKKFICCYNVVVVDKYGIERYFYVRMSYLPSFIKCSLKHGSTITILGKCQEDCFSDFAFRTFTFSELLPF